MTHRRLAAAAPLLAAAALITLLAYAATWAVGARNRAEYRDRALGRVGSHAPVAYYLATGGDDAAAGTTPSTAWRSLERPNRTAFGPGDSLLLEGGRTFAGTLRLDAGDVGTPARPITVTSYGAGAATIDGGAGVGVLVRNTAGVRLTRMVVVGSSRAALDSISGDRSTAKIGTALMEADGVLFVNDLRGDVRVSYVRIDSVDVSGFAGRGVAIDGNAGRSGFSDVRITRVSAHDNGVAGIYVSGEFPLLDVLTSRLFDASYSHRRVYVGHSRAFRNSGVPGRWRPNSGSGIVVSDVRGATVEHSVAFDNGWRCDSRSGGPVGIWAWDADSVVIQYNESYGNRVASRKDGGGFDFDGGVTNSVMQYNYSHDNDGAGYLIYQFPYARPHRSNAVLYNVSRHDGRRNGYTGIQIAGDVRDLRVEHNDVLATPADSDTTAALAVELSKDARRWERPHTTGVRITSNTFRSRGGTPLVRVDSGQVGLAFAGNRYESEGGLTITYAGRRFSSIAAWRGATGQERALTRRR